MSMIEVKTAELIGPALDWAVDWVVSGKPLDVLQKKDGSGEWAYFHEGNWFAPGPRKYSIDWSQGGPLIEKYAVKIEHFPSETIASKANARIAMHSTAYWQSGPTPLVALCRAIVAAKLGDAVSVPEELVQQQSEGSDDE